MTTKANKANFEIFSFLGEYYGICEIGSHGGNCVFGGDSADNDSYDVELIEAIFNNWNGELNEDGKIEY